MIKATEFWAFLRQLGAPTASPDALDVDAIPAGQAGGARGTFLIVLERYADWVEPCLLAYLVHKVVEDCPHSGPRSPHWERPPRLGIKDNDLVGHAQDAEGTMGSVPGSRCHIPLECHPCEEPDEP